MTDHNTSTKEALLSAARELFALKGYEAVSTRELAERAGVNLALIQYHFGSKAGLFIEVAGRLTQESKDFIERFRELSEAPSQQDSAIELCRFVSEFMDHLFRPNGEDACRLVYREMFAEQSSELFEPILQFIIEKHVTPIGGRLRRIIKGIRPELAEREVSLASNSVIGQCIFYAGHRPILTRLNEINPSDPESISMVARQISLFSLRGFGCEEVVIDKAMNKVFR
jgi:AcrR family transcriptional regulator